MTLPTMRRFDRSLCQCQLRRLIRRCSVAKTFTTPASYRAHFLRGSNNIDTSSSAGLIDSGIPTSFASSSLAAASAGHHDEGNHGGPHHHYQASQVGGVDGEGRGHGHVTGPGESHCVAVCAQGRTAAGGCVEGTRLLWN
ncbi:uncharacterized protein LOC6052267 isoform X2 [Culex quinquefasciatus]|uniref:uncharacterized protein LOC6052267 isoform X2 n=1 Tax=Culex quinquefasciatus TaxID=7176 RepID=UPI0018E2F833|nr:uncharacterized protein LOC6052267 isoform X2 [Culex quinquefasciatus]